MTPERLHLILVHLPIVGLMAALIPLAWAALRGDRTATTLGFVTAAAFSVATPLVVATGERAEDRAEQGAGALQLDPAGAHWLEVHEERAEVGAVVLYLAAAVFAGGAVLGLKQPDRARTWSSGGLVLAVGALGVLAWVADAGGKVRHPELRPAGAAPAWPAARDLDDTD